MYTSKPLIGNMITINVHLTCVNTVCLCLRHSLQQPCSLSSLELSKHLIILIPVAIVLHLCDSSCCHLRAVVIRQSPAMRRCCRLRPDLLLRHTLRPDLLWRHTVRPDLLLRHTLRPDLLLRHTSLTTGNVAAGDCVAMAAGMSTLARS